MLLLTTANGNQGKLLLPKLVQAGFEVRACVQSEASATAVRAAGAKEVVIGDIAQADVLARALDGISQVYQNGPSAHPSEREMGMRMIDASVRAGVKHFVFSSVLHAIVTGLVQHEIKRDIEEHLLASGLEFTILQPANYMMPWRLTPAFREGVFRLFWSLDRSQTMVDLGDVTDVAALVLREGKRHYGATYELCGEGRYTAHAIGEVIARVTGRPIAVEEIASEDYRRGLFGDGDRAGVAHRDRVLAGISAHYSKHDFIGNPNVLTWLLGRRPTSFEDHVQAQYALFRASGQV
ncbi:SDR family oxidoreductase [Burkholderia anthina]|uniref:SDR family oxidoreductase n=1 Tax=Burkholderia anthina TaxID=179879 RepID=UPI00158C2AB2|nr:NmrA family NAD(P)-binding protein [Burkholderia anthina]